MKCHATHTEYDVPPEEFNCPRCGAVLSGMFFIEESAAEAHKNCPMLHNGDELRCIRCNLSISGKDFAQEKVQAKKESQPEAKVVEVVSLDKKLILRLVCLTSNLNSINPEKVNDISLLKLEAHSIMSVLKARMEDK
jgi:hypothetical protein